MRFRVIMGALLAGGVLAASVGGGQAGILAYDVAFGTTAGQGHTGPIGHDFIVNSPVQVTALGVYDQSSDGIGAGVTITAQLWRRDDGGTPSDPGDDTGVGILASETFTNAAAGALAPGSGYRMKTLSTPVVLFPGTYTMSGTNFGSSATDQNANGGGGGFGVANDGAGLLTFVGRSRWAAAGLGFPTSPDSHPHQYGTGTFEYEAGGAQYEVAGDGVIGGEALATTRENIVRGPLAGAKRIRLVQNWSDYLHFAEVQAFEQGTGTNKALQTEGASATASSVGWDGAPERAIDGDTNGQFWDGSVWHSGNNSGGDWLQIELGAATTLTSVHLWGRTDCCEERHNDFDLIVEDTGGSQIEFQNVLGMGGDIGVHRDVPVGPILSGEEVATLFSGMAYAFEVDGDTLAADQLIVPNSMPGILTTVLDLNDAELIVELAGGALNEGDVFDILDADEIRGMFASIQLPPADSGRWDLSELYTTGRIQLVPEPATLGLCALAAVGVCGYVRRRKARRGA